MEQKHNCFYSISENRCKQKDWFLWKNMHQSMSRNWENSSSMLQSSPKYFISIELNKSFTVVKYACGFQIHREYQELYDYFKSNKALQHNILSETIEGFHLHIFPFIFWLYFQLERYHKWQLISDVILLHRKRDRNKRCLSLCVTHCIVSKWSWNDREIIVKCLENK